MVAFHGFNGGLEETRGDEYHSIVILKGRGKGKFEVN